MSESRGLKLLDKYYIVAIFLALQALDVLTTYLGLRRGASEANLLPRWIMDNHGEFFMYVAKAAVVLGALLLVVALQGRVPRLWRAIQVANVVMLLVVSINLLALV
jgi:hypothetical protein